MSCLFNSFSYFFDEKSTDIRNKICDYLQNNGVIIEGLSTADVLLMETPNYIQNMLHTSTWGGAIEIQAACNIWNISVIVINIRDTPNISIEFLPISKQIDKIIHIEWSGGHYEPKRL
jgi:hypothetical protein